MIFLFFEKDVKAIWQSGQKTTSVPFDPSRTMCESFSVAHLLMKNWFPPQHFALYLGAFDLSAEPSYESFHHLFIPYGRLVGTHQQAAVIGCKNLTL